MTLNLRARIAQFCPHMTQKQIAAAISDERMTIRNEDISRVIRDNATNNGRNNVVRYRLIRFLDEREREAKES